MRQARNFVILFAAFALVMGMTGTLWAAEKAKTVNINTASEKELMQLEGIGKAKAEAIVKYRKDKGAFKTPEDIRNVPGMGPKLFEKNKGRIVVGDAAKALSPVKDAASKAATSAKDAGSKAAVQIKDAAGKAAEKVVKPEVKK